MGLIGKITEGPWRAYETTRGLPGQEREFWAIGHAGSLYYDFDAALCDKRDPNSEANARLIAAAPELFETLKAITDCYGVSYKSTEQFVKDIHYFMLEGRAALAKACGEGSWPPST